MKSMRSIAAVLVALLPGAPAARGEDDPGARWLGAYAWFQTAEKLAEAEQWPLALGSYLEASRQVEALAEAHPGFEPEMVAYRREALAKTIAEAEARLSTDEHEVMMKYLDFIESLELGEAQRYDNQFEAAHATLDMAKSLLDEIVAVKPTGFREAVAPQYTRLESSLEWLGAQIDLKARSRPRSGGGGFDPSIDWGTTRFVKADDLPADSQEAAVTGALFPAAPLSPAEEAPAETETAPKTEEEATGRQRFRMSSRPGSPPTAPEPPP